MSLTSVSERFPWPLTGETSPSWTGVERTPWRKYHSLDNAADEQLVARRPWEYLASPPELQPPQKSPLFCEPCFLIFFHCQNKIEMVFIVKRGATAVLRTQGPLLLSPNCTKQCDSVFLKKASNNKTVCAMWVRRVYYKLERPHKIRWFFYPTQAAMYNVSKHFSYYHRLYAHPNRNTIHNLY